MPQCVHIYKGIFKLTTSEFHWFPKQRTAVLVLTTMRYWRYDNFNKPALLNSVVEKRKTGRPPHVNRSS